MNHIGAVEKINQETVTNSEVGYPEADLETEVFGEIEQIKMRFVFSTRLMKPGNNTP